jgi:hypothetical protein
MHFGSQAGEWSTEPPITHPPKTIPSNAKTLAALQHQANSRFLTDCYLFPAALSSTARPKMARYSPHPRVKRENPPLALFGKGRISYKINNLGLFNEPAVRASRGGSSQRL